MKRKMIIVLACCMAFGLAACGSNSEDASGLQVETVTQQDAQAQQGADSEAGKDTAQEAETASEPAADDNQGKETSQEAGADAQQAENAEAASGNITEEQALNAVRKYCITTQPDLEDMVNSDDYTIYWEVSTNDAGEIVVLYRSYTAALLRYYIDPATGDTYVTEQVPGIIDDEQKNGETLNIREYID
ncbi:MAG: hypothetical protein K6C96_10825 [Butyrivibrio sp.]|nr:hypothetical protein [Butyrivibrio sp.]